MFFVLACFRFGACAPSPCAKCAPNQPKIAPAIHRGATERTPPARCAAPPRAFQFPRSAPRLPFCLPLCYPFACPSATPRRAPLPARTATPRPIAADRRARVQITPSERRTAPHGTARPSALDIPLCARPFATRLLGLLLAPRLPFCLPLCYPFARPLAWPFARPLGYPSGAWPRLPLGYPSACAFARPHGYPSPPSPRTAAPACRSPQAKGGPLPTERPAPRRSIFPYALGPAPP